MALTVQQFVNNLSPRKMLIPIVLGFGVVAFLFVNSMNKERFSLAEDGTGTHVWVDLNQDGKQQPAEFSPIEDGTGTHIQTTYQQILKQIKFSSSSFIWLFVALLMMVCRDVAYMYRIRLLTDKVISWRKSFDVIMLWEFASAISPSIVGGTAVALFIINKEGVNTGKSASIVLITALLDELFYVVFTPLVILISGTALLFPVEMEMTLFGKTFGTMGIFLIAYSVIFVYSLFLIYAIFVRPRGFKWLLLNVFRLPFLRKWRQRMSDVGDEIIQASTEFSGKGIVFWLKAFGSTVLSWTGRFWVVNFLMLAFFSVGDHFLIYARQLVMWSILILSPTPGGSGIAEFVFSGFFGDLVPVGLAISLALVWRLVSYYPYLFIGSIVLPRWLKRVLSDSDSEE